MSTNQTESPQSPQPPQSPQSPQSPQPHLHLSNPESDSRGEPPVAQKVTGNEGSTHSQAASEPEERGESKQVASPHPAAARDTALENKLESKPSYWNQPLPRDAYVRTLTKQEWITLQLGKQVELNKTFNPKFVPPDIFKAAGVSTVDTVTLSIGSLPAPFHRASTLCEAYHTNYDVAVVIDFECTCIEPRDQRFVQEIIEFPAVMVDLRTGLIVDVFHRYVRPIINTKLTAFCKQLTGIEQHQIDSADDLATVLRQFHEWLSRHNVTFPSGFRPSLRKAYEMPFDPFDSDTLRASETTAQRRARIAAMKAQFQKGELLSCDEASYIDEIPLSDRSRVWEERTQELLTFIPALSVHPSNGNKRSNASKEDAKEGPGPSAPEAETEVEAGDVRPQSTFPQGPMVRRGIPIATTHDRERALPMETYSRTLGKASSAWKCGLLVTDGPWDFSNFLVPECQLKGIDISRYFRLDFPQHFPEDEPEDEVYMDFLNIRQVFYDKLGHDMNRLRSFRGTGLAKMLKVCQLQFFGNEHCGLADTLNIVRLLLVLSRCSLLCDEIEPNQRVNVKTSVRRTTPK